MSDRKIRVFVVDDHPMIRVGLATAINAEDDLEVVGDAGDGPGALAAAPRLAPDVVLMDLYMPRMDGIDAMVRMMASLPDARFIVLTSAADPATVERAIDAGAAGYLLKTADREELAGVIRATYQGRRVLSPEVTDALVASRQRRGPAIDLTPRERELLALMTRGLNNQEIAAELSIAMPTVKFHITNILAKLDAENRTEAVLKALKHKLVPPP
jgi:two-component system, NarL family, response regulator LiaR